MKTSFSPRIPPTRGTELKPPVNIARLKASALRALRSLSDDRQKASSPDDVVMDGDTSDRGSPLPDSSGAAQHDASTAFSRLAQAPVSERDQSRRKQAQEDLIAAFPGGRAGFEESVSALIGGLTDPDRSAIAVLALRGWGDMAVPYLDPALASDNRALRQAVVNVLILIGGFNRFRDQAE